MPTKDRRFHTRTFATGLVAGPAGWMLAGTPGHTWTGVGLLAASAALTAGPVYLRTRRTGGSGVHLGRWDRHNRRHSGVASRWDIYRTSSAGAMRRKAAVLRPSLQGLPWWRRRAVPVISYATPLCKVGRQTVWTSGEESTLRIGIPGTGKTAELACRVIDAPGGVVVTTTATDLYELTAPLRRERGPVAVFNPGGIGAVASTLRWSPLSGCTDPATATRRAADLIGPGSGSEEGRRWEVQGRRTLAVLLHAAAVGGYRMAEVAGWVANPDAGTPQILAALAKSPQAVAMNRAARQVLTTTPRTRDGIMMAIAPALEWLIHPAAAATGDPDPAEGLFTVTDLTDRAGALYLLGDDDGTVAPLTGALAAEIVHQARAVAAGRPGGRLDPGLRLCLDEIALVCPTPLDRWMAELRKRSIDVHAACQGLGQLRQRWGADGASMILNSAAAVLVFGGCKDAKDLALFADLAGTREETTPVHDADGRVTSTSTRRVPVVPAAMLAGLPNHRALLIRRGMPVAIADTPIGWKRRDVRRAAAAQTKAARAAGRIPMRPVPAQIEPGRTGARVRPRPADTEPAYA
jgi:type IV secretory pathway TraG/TraD family ATPase VirD4